MANGSAEAANSSNYFNQITERLNVHEIHTQRSYFILCSTYFARMPLHFSFCVFAYAGKRARALAPIARPACNYVVIISYNIFLAGRSILVGSRSLSRSLSLDPSYSEFARLVSEIGILEVVEVMVAAVRNCRVICESRKRDEKKTTTTTMTTFTRRASVK